MALSASTIWEFNASATASMVNGGGFNTANANFLTDLTTDANTANTASPVVSSASYNFVAGDVGAWLYIASGTNWTPGFYQIASVAANKATLSAAIGDAVQPNLSINKYSPSTVVGCATVGTPTGGTFGIDYSQGTAAIVNGLTDLTCVAGSTTVTSASAPFTRLMVGNIVHLTALTGTGAIVGWYEISNYTNTSNVVLDRTPTDGANNITAGTFYVGGSLSLNSTLDDDFFEIILARNVVYFKSGTYTLGEAVSIASTVATTTLKINLIGYTSVRGSTTTGSNRPIITEGTNTFGLGQNWIISNLIFTGTGTPMLTTGTNNTLMNCKLINTSTTAGRAALSSGSAAVVFNCEATSQNGIGITMGAFQSFFSGNLVHDCDIGIQGSSNAHSIINCIVFDCKTACISITGADPRLCILNNTLYGAAAAPVGVGIRSTSTTASNLYIYNNNIYGFVTGISIATVKQDSIVEDYNNFYNCTTDRTLINTGLNSVSVDPGFAGATQITGSTATTSGSVLTESGGDFSAVTDNVDYVRVVSGTGVTVGTYLITSHTGTTLTTNNALGTSSAGNVVYVVYTGSNYAVGTNLKAVAFPGVFQGSETTGYLDIGAVQRQEAASGGGGSFTFVG